MTTLNLAACFSSLSSADGVEDSLLEDSFCSAASGFSELSADSGVLEFSVLASSSEKALIPLRMDWEMINWLRGRSPSKPSPNFSQ